MKTGEKIAKARKNINLTQDQLAQVLKVSCDYLLSDHELVTAQVSTQNANSYAVDWTKLYLILKNYQRIVDCKKYHKTFTGMIKDMTATYNYSLEDTILVLKDLLYRAYLEMQRQEK